ncbi:MAG: hypothetical protein EBQ96_08845 [Proteobacteria bacterium]|nr:hypothetical protein [Pseudomonadota bacterium]
MADIKNKTCWVIVEEGLAGTESQCVGVCAALGLTPVIKRFNLRQPWKAISLYVYAGIINGYEGDSLNEPWPDIIITGGRKGAAVALWVKKASKGKVFVACLQDPRVRHNEFDLIAVPEHDPARGPNVVVTTAAPNKINTSGLEKARTRWESTFNSLPHPRVAVLVGGNSRAYRMNGKIAGMLGDNLKKIARERKAGLMVTTSRRTGAYNTAILEAWLEGTGAYIWSGMGDNPYEGFLALADAVIVSADSVSMISEAATAGKPVYRVDLEGGSHRFSKFHTLMEQKGIVRPFKGEIESWSYTPLNDAQLVADAIVAKMTSANSKAAA